MEPNFNDIFQSFDDVFKSSTTKSHTNVTDIGNEKAIKILKALRNNYRIPQHPGETGRPLPSVDIPRRQLHRDIDLLIAALSPETNEPKD